MVHRPDIDERLCFVLMPFAEPYSGYYNRIIKPAVSAMGLSAMRADEIYGTNPIIHDIWHSIWKARVVIADVSTKNPNVNYELGLCHALGVTTIVIANKIEDVPFDYRHRRCIIYNIDNVDWENQLSTHLKNTLEVAISENQKAQDLPWPYVVPIKSYPTFISKPVVAAFMVLWLNVLFLLLTKAITILMAVIALFIMMVVLTIVSLTYVGRD